MKLQLLQMQFKKTTMQCSTFSLPCGVQLIISLKIFVRFNWEDKKLGVFAYFPNIGVGGGGGEFVDFKNIRGNCELLQT